MNLLAPFDLSAVTVAGVVPWSDADRAEFRRFIAGMEDALGRDLTEREYTNYFNDAHYIIQTDGHLAPGKKATA